MEANQFVLMCCVFILLAAFMVSMPSISPAPDAKPQLVLICRFETACAGDPCIRQAAPDIRLFQTGEAGWSQMSRADKPNNFDRLLRKAGDGMARYVSVAEADAISTVLTVTGTGTGTGTGAMRFEQTDHNGALIAKGTGFCRKPDVTGAAMTNGDRV